MTDDEYLAATDACAVLRKFDSDKPQAHLLDGSVGYALREVIAVFEHGARKYGKYNCNAAAAQDAERYRAAEARHRMAAMTETPHNPFTAIDAESGLPHKLHQLASLLIEVDTYYRNVEKGEKK